MCFFVKATVLGSNLFLLLPQSMSAIDRYAWEPPLSNMLRERWGLNQTRVHFPAKKFNIFCYLFRTTAPKNAGNSPPVRVRRSACQGDRCLDLVRFRRSPRLVSVPVVVGPCLLDGYAGVVIVVSRGQLDVGIRSLLPSPVSVCHGPVSVVVVDPSVFAPLDVPLAPVDVGEGGVPVGVAVVRERRLKEKKLRNG
jgi:hypothetical protein